MAAKIVILVGPPGSGKSTAAKRLELSGYIRINQDDQGKLDHFYLFQGSLSVGINIVIDRMNFTKEQRERYLNLAKDAGYTTKIVVFHESYETCWNRCLNRVGHPTIKNDSDALKALNFFFKKYERVADSEADEVQRLYPDDYRPKAIICDLDGTLCNIEHRLHWVKGEKKNWPMFFAGIENDTPNYWCLDILERFNRGADSPHIVLCSGRGDDYKLPTKKWLSKHNVSYSHLFMRRAGDYRRDDIVKEILLDFEILTRYEPHLMIDDRKQVVSMWRRRGYTCLQCAEGDF